MKIVLLVLFLLQIKSILCQTTVWSFPFLGIQQHPNFNKDFGVELGEDYYPGIFKDRLGPNRMPEFAHEGRVVNDEGVTIIDSKESADSWFGITNDCTNYRLTNYWNYTALRDPVETSEFIGLVSDNLGTIPFYIGDGKGYNNPIEFPDLPQYGRSQLYIAVFHFITSSYNSYNKLFKSTFTGEQWLYFDGNLIADRGGKKGISEIDIDLDPYFIENKKYPVDLFLVSREFGEKEWNVFIGHNILCQYGIETDKCRICFGDDTGCITSDCSDHEDTCSKIFQCGVCTLNVNKCEDMNNCTENICVDETICNHPPVDCNPSNLPCVIPSCDENTGCLLEEVPGCTPCNENECITIDPCNPMVCDPLNPGQCIQNELCVSTDPCVAVNCIDGECHYYVNCTTSGGTPTTSGGIPTTSSTSSNTIYTTTHNTISSTMLTSLGLSTAFTTGYPDDKCDWHKCPFDKKCVNVPNFHHPGCFKPNKYCMDCKDLQCEKSGHRCKLMYTKSLLSKDECEHDPRLTDCCEYYPTCY